MKKALFLLSSLALSTLLAAAPLLPTLADVPYGDRPLQTLDFYQAKTDAPTPVVFFIHGGGWLNGDKSTFNDARPYVEAGISIVSINYRLIPQAEDEHVVPPIHAPMYDAARALQFIRSKADEWRLDKTRIGASGSSAGACTALWLAFHPDLADPASSDPIARESTRLFCVAVVHPQTSLDPQQMADWIPGISYGQQAFGFKGEPAKKLTPFEQFLAARETILPWIAEYSPYALLHADTPPVYLFYETPPNLHQPDEKGAHSANFGAGLVEKLQQLHLDYEFVHPASPAVAHRDVRSYLLEKLQPAPRP